MHKQTAWDSPFTRIKDCFVFLNSTLVSNINSLDYLFLTLAISPPKHYYYFIAIIYILYSGYFSGGIIGTECFKNNNNNKQQKQTNNNKETPLPIHSKENSGVRG